MHRNKNEYKIRQTSFISKKYRGVFFILGGIFFFCILYRNLSSNILLTFLGKEAQGEVIDIIQRYSHSGNRTRLYYCPKVEYSVGNEVHQIGPENITCSNPSSYEIGDKVTVAYDESSPSTATLKSFGTVIISIVGIVVPILAVGVGILLIIGKPVK